MHYIYKGKCFTGVCPRSTTLPLCFAVYSMCIDIIDPAVLRPGRLDKVVYVGLPSARDRQAILSTITKASHSLYCAYVLYCVCMTH